MDYIDAMRERASAEVWQWFAGLNSTVDELSELHALRATGYLILSVEALIVTWYWPQLFPSPSTRKSSRRRGRRSTDGGRRRTEGGYAYSARGGDGQSFSGPSSTYSGSRPPSTRESSLGDMRDGEPRKATSLSMGEELLVGRLEALAERQASFASADSSLADTPRASEAGDFVTSTGRKKRRRYVRPVLLAALAASATYLFVYLLLAGDSVGSSARPPTTISFTSGGKTDVVRGLQEKTLALKRAAVAVAEKEERAERERRESAERKRKVNAEREDREEVERQREADAKRERIARAQRELKDNAERERRDTAERERRAKIERARVDKAEREAKRERELEERRQRQLAEAALAKEKAETARRKRDEQKRNEQLRMSKLTTLSQDNAPLVLGQTLTRGTTQLKITEKGDLELVTRNKTVWVASGSKKRRNPITWLWRKIRRKPTISVCTGCSLQVTPTGRLELRDRKKLLWWAGESTRTRTNPKKPSAGSVRQTEGGLCVYRLVVTTNGNMELRRGDAENDLVWQALAER